MDSVRFGRALGIGARAAAKTLVTAVDAATAPNPSAASKPAQSNASTSASTSVPPIASSQGRHTQTRPVAQTASSSRVGQRVERTTNQARQTGQGIVRGSKRFGEATWRPLVKLSGVLGLELAGVFFGLFAFFGAGWAWKLRENIHETATNHDEHMRFLICVIMTMVFGYFLVSSFVKANRRGRGR